MKVMTRLTSVGILLVLPLIATAQPSDEVAAVPRTSQGSPDFSGYWEYGTATPLQRPEALGDKSVLTPKEASLFLTDRYTNIARTRDLQLNADWWVPGNLTNGRTSLIIDPPNGRIPQRTAAGITHVETLGIPLRLRSADGPEDRERYERCIMGRSIPMEARPPPRLMQIFQTPDYVVILNEQKSEHRIIPLDGGTELTATIRQWRGDARGHWEDDTLVIETRNFNGKWTFYGTGPEMHLVERLSFIEPNTLHYEFTVNDPASFDASWTVMFPITRATGPLYENACHEGNYSMPLILRGARAEEAKSSRSLK